MRPELPLSLVAEYAFCPRAAWLSFVAGQFQPNAFTVEGALLHRRVHRPAGPEGRPRRFRRVPVWSQRLGLYGYADLVEQYGPHFVPVEYKRGKAKVSWSDQIHVALVALCLEEMLGVSIPRGFLFYFGARRRVEVPLGPDLRRAAVRAVHATRELVAQGAPPPAQSGPRCRGCALAPACLPHPLRTAKEEA
ncbi:MAG: CRISPR-associated protein Cas4 [Candidatus Bipolaricaulaceae bacterium]